MPAAIAVPAIVSAASAAAKIGSDIYSAKKAAKAQEKSTSEALTFEREKEAQRRADYTRALAIWTAGRRALAQRYGIDLGAIGPAEPFTPTNPTPQPRDISGMIQPGLERWSNLRRYGPDAGPQGV